MQNSLLSFIFLLFFSLMISAQKQGQEKIDSLKTVLTHTKIDSVKLTTMSILVRYLYELGDYKESMAQSEELLMLAKKAKNRKAESKAYNNIGNIFLDQSNYVQALKYHNLSLEISQELKDELAIASAYNNIGLLHYYKGDYKEALKAQLKALKIREKDGDEKMIGVSYLNISLVYGSIGERDTEHAYLEKAL
ncbi:tetratricopeptide repeat protein [Moheibacter sp.]|uniref:tetratricopeptide repeat protein n=1 Tax=Moheibacter sp. TaxID=1965316 RepID=UPI003C75CF1A